MGYLSRKSRQYIPKTTSTLLVFDDREKKPLKSKFFKMKKKRLKTGDYTFSGFENVISIERKDNLKELFTNLSGSNRKVFYKELERMSRFKVKCFIVEDNLKNVNTTYREIKKHAPNMKMSPESIYCWLNRTMFEFNIPVLFVGNLFRRNRRAFDMFLSYVLESARKL